MQQRDATLAPQVLLPFVPTTTPRSWDTLRAMVYSVFLYQYTVQ